MEDTPEFWKEAMYTPDTQKVELSGERFLAGTHRATKRWVGRRRKANVKVEEPVMELIDRVMAKEGVSDRRLEDALGLYEKKLKDMRQEDSAWRIMKLARQILWAMGYDLEVRVVKRKNPDRVLVMTNSEMELKKLRSNWEKGKMWRWLGMDKNAGEEGAAGASVPEAGAERSADTGGERHEPDGLGGGDGQGAVNGGGDRDGHDTESYRARTIRELAVIILPNGESLT